MDQDHGNTRSVTFYSDGSPVETFSLASTGDGNSEFVSFTPISDFDSVTWDLGGSGAVGNIGYTTVPEPSSLLLGVLGLPFALRRKR